MTDVLAVAFASTLRQAGLPVPVGTTLVFTRALAEVDLGQPNHVYWAGRATLVHRPEDVPTYDRCFAAFFGSTGDAQVTTAVQTTVELQLDMESGDQPHGDPDDSTTRPPADIHTVRWSATELLRHKDLASCTPDELDEAHRLIAGLRVTTDRRRSRRRQRTNRQRGRPELPSSARRALRTGGEVLRLARSRPSQRPRRLVLLVDVSGSMEPYARALVRFAHAAVTARRRGQVEVFALGTRVTRITHELSSHDPDQALGQASQVVADWAGGTRLGEGVRRFNDRWGVRGLARGSTVIILSDGWDRGDPDVLGTEMARLRRVAHRVLWVNPLKASPGYAPLAQGMAAALPHVDALLEGHSVASLEALANLVGSDGKELSPWS